MIKIKYTKSGYTLYNYNAITTRIGAKVTTKRFKTLDDAIFYCKNTLGKHRLHIKTPDEV